MATKKLAGKKATRSTKTVGAQKIETPRDLWLASLGAVSVTRKQGARFVEGLLQQGQDLRERTLKLAEGTVNGARKQVVGVIGKVQQKAAANLSQVETVVGTQVTRVLSRIGVPSKADIQELSRRVADLNRQVKALQNSRKADAKAA